jgi:hypothetical protein
MRGGGSVVNRTPAQIAEAVVVYDHGPLCFSDTDLNALAVSHRDLLAALKMYVAYRKSGEGASHSKRAQQIRLEMNTAIENAIRKAEGL